MTDITKLWAALEARGAPKPWTIAGNSRFHEHSVVLVGPYNEDVGVIDGCEEEHDATGAAIIIAANHFGATLKALEKAEIAEQHFAKCSYELGPCETATEDDGMGVSCKEYLRLVDLATAARALALAAILKDLEAANA